MKLVVLMVTQQACALLPIVEEQQLLIDGCSAKHNHLVIAAAVTVPELITSRHVPCQVLYCKHSHNFKASHQEEGKALPQNRLMQTMPAEMVRLPQKHTA